jgi:tripartite-type tricarboxylate transporter receptor subunit TctC
VVCRLLFNRLSERTGHAYIIENRPGAAGTIAGTLVARAPSDGSTLLYDATAHSVNPALFGPRLPYDTQRDFLPVFLSLITPNTILAGNGFGPRSVPALIAAKAAPDSIDAGTAGIGSAQHITLALFNAVAGTRINHVVYRDAPAARSDLIAGRIHLQFSNVPGSVGLLQTGAARRGCWRRPGQGRSPCCRGWRRSARPCRASRPMSGTASSCPPARRRRSAAT